MDRTQTTPETTTMLLSWEAWIVVMRGKRNLAKSTEQFYLTRAEAEKALANHPDAPYWEVTQVLVSWPEPKEKF